MTSFFASVQYSFGFFFFFSEEEEEEEEEEDCINSYEMVSLLFIINTGLILFLANQRLASWIL